MGKNKGKKKDNPVFKVAGKKVTKAKAKQAKPVLTNLKRLNQPSKSKTEKMDDTFTEVYSSLVASGKDKAKVSQKINKAPTKKDPVQQVDVNTTLEEFASCNL